MTAAAVPRRGPGQETLALAVAALVVWVALGALAYLGPAIHLGGHAPASRAATVAPQALGLGAEGRTALVAQPLGYLTIAGTATSHLPIFDRGLDARGRMEVAPGAAVTHYSPSSPLGGTANTVLYAPASVLGNLGMLHKGDVLTVESAGGPVFRFVLQADPGLVAASDVKVLQPGDSPKLTIFTDAGPSAPDQRLLVVAAPVPAGQ